MSVVKELREKGSSEDRDTVKKLRKTQTNLRLMQSELVVEEAVRDRSMKVQHYLSLSILVHSHWYLFTQWSMMKHLMTF